MHCNEDSNQSTKYMFDWLCIDFWKENIGNQGESRQIPDQDSQYPIIPDWHNIWYQYPYPIRTRSDPKYFFQYPIHTRPEVKKPYPSDPGEGAPSQQTQLDLLSRGTFCPNLAGGGQKKISHDGGIWICCQKVTWLSSIQTIGCCPLGESDKSRITSLTWKSSPSYLRVTMKPLATFFEERNSTLQTITWGRWAITSSKSATETFFWG